MRGNTDQKKLRIWPLFPNALIPSNLKSTSLISSKIVWYIVNSKQILLNILVFLFPTLNKWMPAGQKYHGTKISWATVNDWHIRLEFEKSLLQLSNAMRMCSVMQKSHRIFHSCNNLIQLESLISEVLVNNEMFWLSAAIEFIE